MFTTERMFIIIGAFLFGYCLGNYSFEIFKYKNRKHEIHDFFSNYNKKYGMQHKIFDRKNGRTETIAGKLLKVFDRFMDENLFQTNGLRQLGWCAHYMLDTRSLNYYTEDKKPLLQKTEVTEFYWFNNSPNRAFKQQLVTKTEVCNCIYCQCFMFKFLEIKQNAW